MIVTVCVEVVVVTEVETVLVDAVRVVVTVVLAGPAAKTEVTVVMVRDCHRCEILFSKEQKAKRSLAYSYCVCDNR